MYKFIENRITVSVLMGFLFGGTSLCLCLSVFSNISFAQQVTSLPAIPATTATSGNSSNGFATTSTAAAAAIPANTTVTSIGTTTLNGASDGTLNTSKSDKPVQFNHYENNELGISIKYPSNFLVDESNSNNTLSQISFYPVSNATSGPERYILWMDIFIQNQGILQQQKQQHTLLSLSKRLLSSSSNSLVSNNDLASYSVNLANSIQQGNKDTTIVGSDSNTTLSGYPAYKLITQSYIGSTAIVDVLMSTIVNNTIYSLDYQTNSSNYLNSVSDANKIIQSFKIMTPSTLSTKGNSPNLPSLASQSTSVPPNEKSAPKQSSSTSVPLLTNMMSSLQVNNIANNSTQILKSLKNSATHSLNDFLSNPQNAIDNSIKGTTSLLPPPPPELSSLTSSALKKACVLPLVSGVCNEIANSVSNKG